MTNLVASNRFELLEGTQRLSLCTPDLFLKTYVIDTGIFHILDVKNNPARTDDSQGQLALDANTREVVG